MKPVKTHRFNGVPYIIDVEPHDGFCEPPPGGKYEPRLAITNGIPYGDEDGAKSALMTLIHECLHASGWTNKHTTVERVSNDIGRLLWRLGYRRVYETDKQSRSV